MGPPFYPVPLPGPLQLCWWQAQRLFCSRPSASPSLLTAVPAQVSVLPRRFGKMGPGKMVSVSCPSNFFAFFFEFLFAKFAENDPGFFVHLLFPGIPVRAPAPGWGGLGFPFPSCVLSFLSLLSFPPGEVLKGSLCWITSGEMPTHQGSTFCIYRHLRRLFSRQLSSIPPLPWLEMASAPSPVVPAGCHQSGPLAGTAEAPQHSLRFVPRGHCQALGRAPSEGRSETMG